VAGTFPPVLRGRRYTTSTDVTSCETGIRVNAVCTGATRTPMNDEYFASDEEREEFIRTTHPHGRLIEPEEIAEAIAYLASSRSASLVCAVLTVDGSCTIQ